MNEETKQHWIRVGTIAIITFLVSYLAFCIAIKHNLRKLSNPFYQAKNFERIMEKQQQELEKYALDKMENPFEPKMRPMLVNLVKESSEYNVIVDLTPLDDNENNINVSIQDNELMISGQMDKKIRGNEKIISFTQTYLLDEKIKKDKITKEKKGNKYIITIPFED